MTTPTLQLDAYAGGLWAAYALKRLLSAYTGPSIRVRRDSDNAEIDIGFVPATGLLDISALNAFGGAESLSVVRWYDQSGGGNDFLAPSQSAQPGISVLGVYNGKLRFDGTVDCLSTVNASPASSAFTVFTRMDMANPFGTWVLFEHTSNENNFDSLNAYTTSVGFDLAMHGVSPLGSVDNRYAIDLSDAMHAWRYDRAQPVLTQASKFVNGTFVPFISSFPTGATITGLFQSDFWHLASRNNASLFAPLNTSLFAIYRLPLSDGDIATIGAILDADPVFNYPASINEAATATDAIGLDGVYFASVVESVVATVEQIAVTGGGPTDFTADILEAVDAFDTSDAAIPAPPGPVVCCECIEVIPGPSLPIPRKVKVWVSITGPISHACRVIVPPPPPQPINYTADVQEVAFADESADGSPPLVASQIAWMRPINSSTGLVIAGESGTVDAYGQELGFYIYCAVVGYAGEDVQWSINNQPYVGDQVAPDPTITDLGNGKAQVQIGVDSGIPFVTRYWQGLGTITATLDGEPSSSSIEFTSNDQFYSTVAWDTVGVGGPGDGGGYGYGGGY